MIEPICAGPSAGDTDGEAVEPALSREAVMRWSGVACLYAGTAAALALLWGP